MEIKGTKVAPRDRHPEVEGVDGGGWTLGRWLMSCSHPLDKDLREWQGYRGCPPSPARTSGPGPSGSGDLPEEDRGPGGVLGCPDPATASLKPTLPLGKRAQRTGSEARPGPWDCSREDPSDQDFSAREPPQGSPGPPCPMCPQGGSSASAGHWEARDAERPIESPQRPVHSALAAWVGKRPQAWTLPKEDT